MPSTLFCLYEPVTDALRTLVSTAFICAIFWFSRNEIELQVLSCLLGGGVELSLGLSFSLAGWTGLDLHTLPQPFASLPLLKKSPETAHSLQITLLSVRALERTRFQHAILTFLSFSLLPALAPSSLRTLWSTPCSAPLVLSAHSHTLSNMSSAAAATNGSTPSPSPAPSTSTTAGVSTKSAITSADVGWQFVPQY